MRETVTMGQWVNWTPCKGIVNRHQMYHARTPTGSIWNMIHRLFCLALWGRRQVFSFAPVGPRQRELLSGWDQGALTLISVSHQVRSRLLVGL